MMHTLTPNANSFGAPWLDWVVAGLLILASLVIAIGVPVLIARSVRAERRDDDWDDGDRPDGRAPW